MILLLFIGFKLFISANFILIRTAKWEK